MTRGLGAGDHIYDFDDFHDFIRPHDFHDFTTCNRSRNWINNAKMSFLSIITSRKVVKVVQSMTKCLGPQHDLDDFTTFTTSRHLNRSRNFATL
jgi:hypothetical protein